MERRLARIPEFDFDALRTHLDNWKTAGAKTVIVEWNTGPGPVVFYYPSGEREFGVKWTETVPPTMYNELYADYIEFTLAPKLNELVASRGMVSKLVCVDQQPILAMRLRRRQIERAQHAVHAH